MLKAVQILGCCSFGLVWRRRNSGGPSFISVSAKPLSYSSSSRRLTGKNSLFLAEFPARRSRCLRAFHASAACSESNPDGASSVAFPSSAVSFADTSFLSICWMVCYVFDDFLQFEREYGHCIIWKQILLRRE